jgi:polysaccharide pyruvyl transferase WcaK-like protein
MSRRRMRIAFFGHFGRGNFGNESTLLAMLNELRQLLPEAEFSCICTGPETVASRYAIRTVPCREVIGNGANGQSPLLRRARKLALGLPRELYRWLKSLKTLRSVDALIVPGTGLLSDAYTLFGWGPYDMFRWSLAAKVSRCKLLFVSVGAGPLYSRKGRFFVKSALSLADFRSYRDESSKCYLKTIGLRTDHDPDYPDLAFSLRAVESSIRKENKDRSLVVGIGLMEYAGTYSVERPRNETYANYMDALASFAKWLLARGHRVRLLIGDVVDVPIIQEFRELLKFHSVVGGDDRILDEPVETVDDLLSQIAATDFVAATRFHNVLFSMLLNKPVMAISFHHKCSSLMSQMGLSEYCADINDLRVSHLIERFTKLEESADSLKAMMAEKVKERQRELNEQYAAVLDAILPGQRSVTASDIKLRADSRNGRECQEGYRSSQ